jgi:anti-anti-sigma factor
VSTEGTLPNVGVELRPTSEPEFAAVVRLCGEHDLATSDEVRDAIEPISGNVLVDLSECAFIHSTVLSVLLAASKKAKREGHRIELLVTGANTGIARVLQVSGIETLIGVRRVPIAG